jgi:hypothetical protein
MRAIVRILKLVEQSKKPKKSVVGRAELMNRSLEDEGGSIDDVRLLGKQTQISTVVVYTPFANHMLTPAQQRERYMLNHSKALVECIFNKTMALANMQSAARPGQNGMNLNPTNHVSNCGNARDIVWLLTRDGRSKGVW